MKKGMITVFLIMIVLVSLAKGVSPKKYEIRTVDDFLKGEFYGISVSYEGILSLSLKEESIKGPEEGFYLSTLITSSGTIYLGTGHEGKIYKIGKDDEVELYFDVPEMDIYCLAQGPDGNLYAGSSPNGKVYRISEKGEGEVFFNPKEKYIWDLFFTEEGDLLAGVGEKGGIYQINPEGEGKAVVEIEESHILCIEKGDDGKLILGSGGKGCVYELSSGNKVSILYESPFEEIKSLTLDKEGNIYAGASGHTLENKTGLSPSVLETSTNVQIEVTPDSTKTVNNSKTSKKNPSALYKINKTGIIKKLWHSDDEMIYSLHWDEMKDRLLFGTGNKGRIYSVDKDENISLLIQKDSEQVYDLYPLGNKIYIVSNNPADLSVVEAVQRLKGEYVSNVVDSKIISSWGRLAWEEEIPSDTFIRFQTRSGNSSEPDSTWSDWSPPYKKADGEPILSPRSRYIQFKVIFSAQSTRANPILREVSIFYLQSNIPPKIEKLIFLPPNQVLLKPPQQSKEVWGADIDFYEQAKNANKQNVLSAKKAEKKGYRTLIWSASDENEDDLIYSIQMRKEEESRWRILRNRWPERIFAFNTFNFPDGVYYIKIIVSDAPSNPEKKEQKTEKVSRPLIFDNSLPEIKEFREEIKGRVLTATFVVEDSMTQIKEVQYRIMPGEWETIFPEDGICDSKKESFNVQIPLKQNSDNLITIKAKDRYDNIGVYRYIYNE